MKRAVLPLALMLGLAVSSASAQVIILDNLQPVGPGLTENPNCFGFAVLAYDPAEDVTNSVYAIFNFRRNTTYGVGLDSNVSGFCFSTAITTNFFGFGFFQGPPVPGNVPEADPVWTVYRELGDPLDCFDVTEDEIRARTQ